MANDYQSILSLMNIIILACAGITSVGFYRILKALGWIPWESPPIGRNRELENETILTSIPKVTHTACIPGKECGRQLLSKPPKVAGTTCAAKNKIKEQALIGPIFE